MNTWQEKKKKQPRHPKGRWRLLQSNLFYFQSYLRGVGEVVAGNTPLLKTLSYLCSRL